MSAPHATSLTLASLRAHHLNEVASRFLARRPLIIGASGVVLCAVLWLGPVPRPQAIAVTAGFCVVLSMFMYERHLASTRTLTAREFERSLWWTTIAITALSCATGGVYTPMLPLFFAPVITTFAAFGRGQQSVRMIAALTLTAPAMLCATLAAPELRIAEPYRTGLLCCTLLTSMALLYLSVTGVMRALDRSAFEIEAMRAAQHQRTLRRAEEMESMSAHAAHELKTPLSTIKGLVELQARQHPSHDARQTRRFDVIMHEIERSQSLIQEHLNFARRMTDLHVSPHHLHEVIARLQQLADAHHDKDHVVVFTHHLDERADSLRILIDLDKLYQALVNLVQNAQDASPTSAEILLTLTLDDARLLITVHDHGEGMSQEVLAQVGSPYMTSKQSGTGLGVLITRAIIVQHGGQLTYESTHGEGTTARILLPLITQESAV